MKRRAFIAALGSAAAWPVVARAQQGERVRRIGVLMNVAASDQEGQSQVAALVLQLKELGWADGRNVQFDYRWAAGDANRMRTLARELVELQPDVILTRSTPATAALQKETQTIPIIFVAVSDPVGEGFVASVARPGGNVTGFTNAESSMASKWLALLKEIAPRIMNVALIFNPETAPGGGSYYVRLVESAAQSLAVGLIKAPLRDPAEIDPALATLAREPSVGLIVLPDFLTNVHRELIILGAARYRLPAVYTFRYMAAEGGLMSYGIDLADLFRRAASYVDRVLKGAKPADLPVQLPTKYELVLNLKTAKTLGVRERRNAKPRPANPSSIIAHVDGSGTVVVMLCGVISIALPVIGSQPWTVETIAELLPSIQYRDLVISLAARHRLPAVYAFRQFITAGGLMSYGTDLFEQYRQAASYVDRILRGANPADFPVQAPTKYQTVINLRAAKAIGVAVPPTLLVRADEVIE